jgi:Fe-S-cluster containining protein
MSKKEKQLQKAFNALEKVYKEIPETEGCLKYTALPKEQGGCGGHCCQYINPHVMKVEFLRSWTTVLRTWDWEEICALIERAIRNYLSSYVTKSCIFWNKDTKLCMQHRTRPLQCYLYGITPDEEMKPRIERLRILYKDQPGAVFKDQCNLVTTVDGRKVTTKMTDDWHKQTMEIEESIGIKKKDIHDKEGGTYLTFHDHLLLHICPSKVMKQLQILRFHGNNTEKEIAIKGIIDGFRNKIQGLDNEKQEINKETEIEDQTAKEETAEEKPSISDKPVDDIKSS